MLLLTHTVLCLDAKQSADWNGASAKRKEKRVASCTSYLSVDTKSFFYSDLPRDEAEHWESLLVPKSASRTSVDVAEDCYDLNVPTTCALCTEDSMITGLEKMLAKVKRESWQVTKMGGGHSPFLSRKEDLIGLMEDCLGFRDSRV